MRLWTAYTAGDVNNSIFATNEKLAAKLGDAIGTGAVFHAYIFVSNQKEDAEAFAKLFIKGILLHKRLEQVYETTMDMTESRNRDSIISARVDEDRHEDLIVIRRSGTRTRIESIRDMQSRIAVRPIGERHIVLIADGDEMREEAQNALLKTLEEPPGNTVLIIVSQNVENLLPTVRSRSIVCQVDEGDASGSDMMREIAAKMIDMAAAGAAYYRLKEETAKIADNREEMRRFIDTAEDICRERIFMRDNRGIPISLDVTTDAIRALEEARNKLDRGLSPRYTMKDLLLRIGG